MAALAPEPLRESHDLSGFSSGGAAMDSWLKMHALRAQASGRSHTFVIVDANQAEGGRVVAYYALAIGAVSRAGRDAPAPIPVALLFRLAIDRSWQWRGLGRVLFRDCATRLVAAAEPVGIECLLVHAVSEAARTFYLTLGFETSPLGPMTLMLRLGDIRAALGTS